MLILSENLRYLRAQLKSSQQKIADDLMITRGRYAKYEENDAEPPLELLMKIARYFHVSMDLLVSVDLRRFPLDELLQLSDNRILLPIMVDQTGENTIEVIPYKASMGYLNGYNDPGYIESLQHISLPFLRNGKYRAFPAEGDSMPPFKDGTYIVGKYVEKIQDLKVGKTYLFITLTHGFAYKRLEELNEHSVTVKSNNTFYDPYEIPLYELTEIWEFACSISTDEFDLIDLANNEIKAMFLSLKEDIKRLEKSNKS